MTVWSSFFKPIDFHYQVYLFHLLSYPNAMSSDSEKDLDEIFGGIEDHIIEIEEDDDFDDELFAFAYNY